jgi:hypothetical protein
LFSVPYKTEMMDEKMGHEGGQEEEYEKKLR